MEQKGIPMKLNNHAKQFQEEMEKLRTKYGRVTGNGFQWSEGINRHIARKIARKLARKAA